MPLPDDSRRYLRARGVPSDIIGDLEQCCFESWLPIGPIALIPLTHIAEQNDGLFQEKAIEGFVALAAGANGDPIALDVTTRRMHFLSYEEMQILEKDLLQADFPTPYLYEEFWNAVANTQGFPWDYYEARRQWQRCID